MSHSSSITGSSAAIADGNIEEAQACAIEPQDSSSKAEVFSGIKWIDKIVGDYDFDRYGVSAIALIVVGIFSGTAVFFGAMTSSLEIAILIVPAMVVLVMIIGVQPVKYLIWALFFSVMIDLIVIAYHLLAWSEHLEMIF
jgi:hypothetical protein